MASKAITAPTTIPAVMPFSFASVETLKIASMRIAVSKNSKTKDWMTGPAGWLCLRDGFGEREGEAHRSPRLHQCTGLRRMATPNLLQSGQRTKSPKSRQG